MKIKKKRKEKERSGLMYFNVSRDFFLGSKNKTKQNSGLVHAETVIDLKHSNPPAHASNLGLSLHSFFKENCHVPAIKFIRQTDRVDQSLSNYTFKFKTVCAYAIWAIT